MPSRRRDRGGRSQPGVRLMPDFDTNADGIPGTLLSAAIDRVRFRRPVLVAILCD